MKNPFLQQWHGELFLLAIQLIHQNLQTDITCSCSPYSPERSMDIMQLIIIFNYSKQQRLAQEPDPDPGHTSDIRGLSSSQSHTTKVGGTLKKD